MDIATDINLRSITFCKYQLRIAQKDILISFPQLLELRNRVNHLSDPNSLEAIINGHNFILLFIADRQHLVYLEVAELLALQDEINAFLSNSNPVLI
jgi:hypothetical protein